MNDSINRQAAIDAWKEDFKEFVNSLDMPRDDYKGIMEFIDELPSARPTYTDAEIQKMQDLESAEIEKAYQLGYEEGKNDAQPKQRWIPCSERMPNKKEVVLITNDKGNVRSGQFRGTHGKYWIWKSNTLETVLAWMPLPKPWKGADDEHDK